ncbi:unnamed protein product [Effrenium voratum]|nr:unnamed protein product [Effrenium voratum]
MTVDGAKKTRNLSKQQQIDLVVKLLSQKSSLAKSVAERVEQGKTVTAQGLEFDVPVLRAALAKWEAHKSSAQLESDRPATPPCKRARRLCGDENANPGNVNSRSTDEPAQPPASPRKPSSEAKTDASPPLQELSVKALKARLAQHGLDAGTCVEKAELQAMWERFETWRRRPLSELQDHCQIEGGSRFETAEECARYLTTPRQPAVRAARVAPPSAPAPAVPSAPATCSTTSPGGPAAAVDREQDAKSEAGRILPLRRESFMNPTSWGFAVLGVPTATKEVSTVQRAYRSLMRKLHPDRAGQSEDVVKAVEKVREAKEACERGLSRQEPPEPPRQLRSEALCSTPGRRRFQLCWTAPPVRESASVRRYIVAAHDPAYGRALTITVLEPDYSQELRSFVAIESLTSYVIAEEDLQKMPKLWTEKMLQVQVAAANEAGQSKWTSLKIPLTGPAAGIASAPLSREGAPRMSPPCGATWGAGGGAGGNGAFTSAATMRRTHDSADVAAFDKELRKLRGSTRLRAFLEPLKKGILQEWLRSVNWSSQGSKQDLVERVIFIREAMVS